jgi:uncharacterized membrane protein YphA (DoxX/SURF4 family)
MVMRLPRAAVWACAIFLAVVFVYAGVTKVYGPPSVRWAERLTRWGYPAGAHYVIGVSEVLAGIGLLIPSSRRSAAAILVILMIGALGTHALQAEFARLIPPVVLGGLALLLYASHSRSVEH